MALPMLKSPAPPNRSPALPMLPQRGHDLSSGLRESPEGPAHRPPRLHQRDLDVLDIPSVLGLIQSLAAPDFLRAHSFHGDPAQIARYVNKEILHRVYNLMYDTEAWRARVSTRRRRSGHDPPPPEADAASAAAGKGPVRRRRKEPAAAADPPWQLAPAKPRAGSRARSPRGAFLRDPRLGREPQGVVQDAYGNFVPAPISQVLYGGWARAGLQGRPALPGRGPVIATYTGREGGEAEPPPPAAAGDRAPGRDFVRENLEAQAAAPLRPAAARIIAGQVPGALPDAGRLHPPGQLPRYLVERQVEEQVRRRIRDDAAANRGPRPMPEAERLAMLQQLQERHGALMREVGATSLRGAADGPMRPSVVRRQEALELQLREVEGAIRHFSRAHVYLAE